MASDIRRLPPLASLVPFEAAMRHRNFTRAGEELHFSQATISRRIGALEADLGVVLFERGRHDVSPTEAAEVLAAALQSAFGELSSTAAMLRRRANDVRTFTVYSDISLATSLVAPIIGDFQRQHPDLEIRVLSSFEPIETTLADFDVGLQYRHSEPSRFDEVAIADDQVFPVCAPGVAERLRSPVTVAQLVQEPLLHVDYGDSDWTDWQEFLDKAGGGGDNAGAGAIPSDGLTFTSYQVCLDVAARGEGIALGWGRSVRPFIDAGRLVRLPGMALAHRNAITAYRPHRPAPDPVVDDFLATLVASL